jgi:hypothetical protein
MPRMKRTSSAATRRTSSTPSDTHLDQLTTEFQLWNYYPGFKSNSQHV